MEKYMNNPIIHDLRNRIAGHLQNKQLPETTLVIDNLVNGTTQMDPDIRNYAIVEFSAVYIHIAELLIIENATEAGRLLNKALGIFSQRAKDVPELILFIYSNKALALLLKYDIKCTGKAKAEGARILTYGHQDSIFEIRDELSSVILNYREALKVIKLLDNPLEGYNIRNNLANALLRTGRYLEAISLYEKSILELPSRWESRASLSDCLSNLIDAALIGKTPSLYYVIAEGYSFVLEQQVDAWIKSQIEVSLSLVKFKLEDVGFTFKAEDIEKNRAEEMVDYEKHTDYRKFILSNDLSLNEHAVYCKCRITAKDDLKIGLRDGSVHVSVKDLIPRLDGLINRLISEYAFSRLQFYNYLNGIGDFENDVQFSVLSGFDASGYKIEQLRVSYRLAYSILDKIANGIIDLLDIERGIKATYFENVFDTYKSNFEKVKNIHLTALYSISLDLNKDWGSFKHFKVLRNEMEHGFLGVNDTDSANIGVTIIRENELKEFTLELLQLTRSAIFSFTFFIRTHTLSQV